MHVHTQQHNNEVDKTKILQRNGLMLNRNIKKRIDKTIYFCKLLIYNLN